MVHGLDLHFISDDDDKTDEVVFVGSSPAVISDDSDDEVVVTFHARGRSAVTDKKPEVTAAGVGVLTTATEARADRLDDLFNDAERSIMNLGKTEPASASRNTNEDGAGSSSQAFCDGDSKIDYSVIHSTLHEEHKRRSSMQADPSNADTPNNSQGECSSSSTGVVDLTTNTSGGFPSDFLDSPGVGWDGLDSGLRNLGPFMTGSISAGSALAPALKRSLSSGSALDHHSPDTVPLKKRPLLHKSTSTSVVDGFCLNCFSSSEKLARCQQGHPCCAECLQSLAKRVLAQESKVRRRIVLI